MKVGVGTRGHAQCQCARMRARLLGAGGWVGGGHIDAQMHRLPQLHYLTAVDVQLYECGYECIEVQQ
jgi:hypothetical protein